MEPQALYVQLGRLLASMPSLNREGPTTPETYQWLARAYALVSVCGNASDPVDLKFLTDTVVAGRPFEREAAARKIAAIIHRSLAVAELNAPAAAQGAFIPAGNALDAMAAFGKVVSPAKSDVLIVDPYMDEKALTDFAILAHEGIAIRLLADGTRTQAKPCSGRATMVQPVRRGASATGTSRAHAHSSDRVVIVDGSEVWLVTQSLNAIAARSPAAIVRVEGDATALKLAAYQAMWDNGSPL